MNATQLQSLINGGNITRWSSIDAATKQANTQHCLTGVLLGCDGRFWVAATPRIAARLIKAGYEAAH